MAKLILVLTLIICNLYGINSSGKDVDSNERIVGGYIAPDGQFPYQVSLRTFDNRHFCGGSIIDATWILTAAHCVDGQNTESIFAAVGTNFLNQGGRGYLVTKILCHPNYNPMVNINDIALVQLAGTITFNTKVQPVPLGSSYVAVGELCVLSGWGLTSYPSKQVPNYLQYIFLPPISNTQCKNLLPGFPVTSANLCTYTVSGKGACKGDSGGPLYCNGNLHGVVSWGIPCAQGRPDVFTSVSFYREWIAEVTGI